MRERTYYSVLKSDLKNLATQQEIYYGDRYAYSGDEVALGFATSEEVTITIGEFSDSGWNATATHLGLETNEGCGTYYGAAAAPTIGSVAPASPGAIACTGS